MTHVYCIDYNRLTAIKKPIDLIKIKICYFVKIKNKKYFIFLLFYHTVCVCIEITIHSVILTLNTLLSFENLLK